MDRFAELRLKGDQMTVDERREFCDLAYIRTLTKIIANRDVFERLADR